MERMNEYHLIATAAATRTTTPTATTTKNIHTHSFGFTDLCVFYALLDLAFAFNHYLTHSYHLILFFFLLRFIICVSDLSSIHTYSLNSTIYHLQVFSHSKKQNKNKTNNNHNTIILDQHTHMHTHYLCSLYFYVYFTLTHLLSDCLYSCA